MGILVLVARWSGCACATGNWRRSFVAAASGERSPTSSPQIVVVAIVHCRLIATQACGTIVAKPKMTTFSLPRHPRFSPLSSHSPQSSFLLSSLTRLLIWKKLIQSSDYHNTIVYPVFYSPHKKILPRSPHARRPAATHPSFFHACARLTRLW